MCSLPVWEHDYYWRTMAYIKVHNDIDLDNIPPELQQYKTKDIKKSLKYAEQEDKVVQRVNINKWKWIK